MSVQTTFNQDPAIATPGMLYDSAPNDIRTCIAQEDIPYGAGVRIDGQYCELPDSTGEVTGNDFGVAVHDVSGKAGGYKAGDTVPVLVRGRVWVLTEQGLANGARPFVRFAGTGAKGAWRNDADTAAAVQPTHVRTYRGVGAAGLAVLQLDYPNMST